MLLDYTYTNADTTCGIHFNISGWTESPYNSSEYVLEIPYSVTGDCLNYEDVDLVFMPGWELYIPGAGSAKMRPLFTNTSGWYAGMDLQDSPVALFRTQTEIHVEGRSTISLSFGSLECWCVKALTDYPSPTNSSFYFDIEWGICVRYSYAGPYLTTHELYSASIEFESLSSTETTPTLPDTYDIILGTGIIVELVVLGVILRYMKLSRR